MIKPNSCLGCPLAPISDGFLEPEGHGNSGVAIIGEAAGYEEYIDGKPFRPHAQAGSKLEEVFRLVAKDTSRPCNRDHFRLWNLIGCRPPGNELRGKSYESGAIHFCKQYFHRHMNDFRTQLSKTLLGLGNLPLMYLGDFSGAAEDKQSISHLRGYVLKCDYGWFVPSYHPSFIRRGNGHLTTLLVQDLKKAMAVARGEFNNFLGHPSYTPPTYQVAPSLDEARSYLYKVRDNQKLVLAYDIETPDSRNIEEDEREELASEIIMVQFSTGMSEGVAMPFQGGYIEIIKELLGTENIKAGHNCWNFDNPRLRAKGIEIKGRCFDTMWMFKHWNPGLPRGLQQVASLFNFPFPWKHLYTTQLEWYGCADVDATQWIINKLPSLMKARGVWDGFIKYVVNLHLVLDRASSVGIPVSEDARQVLKSKFETLREGLDKELQTLVPDEARNVKPRRVDKQTKEVDYGYIREPKCVREATERYTLLSELAKTRGYPVKRSLEEWLYLKHGIVYAKFQSKNVAENDMVEGSFGEVFRWCKIEPFKASSVQMVKYLKCSQRGLLAKAAAIKDAADRLRGEGQLDRELSKRVTVRVNGLRELAKEYEVPIHLKTKRATTGKAELNEIYERTGDQVLEKVVRIRSLETNLNNFIPNWTPGKDGRVHTTFGFTAPTGQLDARGPNILNCSKHTEYGNEFRGIIEAPPGFTFVEFDKHSFHVSTTGYCANDKDYIRLGQLDPHSIIGSYIDPSVLGESVSFKWSDKDIMEACKEFKKRCKEHKAKDPSRNVDVRQELAKPTVLGNQLELGATRLQRQNRRFIRDIKDAERLQAILFDMFPKVERHKKWVKEKAFLESYLLDEFGRIQYFNEVFRFSWNKNGRCWSKQDGPGAREPIAFRVQGTAFGMIQLEMLEMEKQGMMEEYNFQVSIHDSIVMMPGIANLNRCIEGVIGIMNKPCPLLVNEATGPEGLRVGVEVSVGKNWGAWSEGNREGMREVKI